MNSITICVQLIAGVESKSISNGQTVTESKVTKGKCIFIHGYGDKETHDEIDLEAWNGVGDQLYELSKVDGCQAILLVTGRIDVNKIVTPEGNRNMFVLVANTITPMPKFVKVNVFNIAGNVGQDPDVKYFESGKVKASSTLAVNRTKDLTNWFGFTAWDKSAETMANYVRKGSKIGLTGELTCEHWKDRNDGSDRSKFGFKVDHVTLIAKAGEQQQSAASHDPMDDEF